MPRASSGQDPGKCLTYSVCQTIALLSCCRGVPGTVVVVDDDESIREAMLDLLALEGYTVLSARDGAEALQVLAAAPRPCVAVVDLVMPKVDGWRLVETIASEAGLRGIGVVCCTAGRSDAPPGCSSLLRKPFAPESLVVAVEQASADARQRL
jgi:CheY-like chemotaxis protein